MGRGRLLRYLGWAALVIAGTGLLYWVYGILFLRTPTEITIAAGREGGTYYRTAEKYADILAQSGVTLHILPTAGSVENLELLREGKVEVALLQGGVSDGQEPGDLFALGSLFYEPLWLFYRADRFSDLKLIADLKGRRVGVGEVGSGTYVLANQVLSLNGVTDANSTFVREPSAAMAEHLVSGELDAALFVMGQGSSLLPTLLSDPEIALNSVPNPGAYSNRYKVLSAVELSQGAVDLAKNIPAESKTLIATTAALVGNSRLHIDSSRQLLNAAIEVHGKGGFFEDEGEFPSVDHVDFPVPTNVKQYLDNGATGLERYLPLSLATRIEQILFIGLPFFLLLYPLLRPTPLFWSFVMRYRIFRWYKYLRSIEAQLDGYDVAALDKYIGQLTDLEGRLTQKLRLPLFFQRDFYMLRQHMQLVRKNLEDRRAELLQASVAAQPLKPDAEVKEAMQSTDADYRELVESLDET